MNSKRSICLVKLPRAGLGNKLFLWAQGISFAEKNRMDCLAQGWTKIHIGPILRREKSRRFYLNYFKKPILSKRLRLWWLKLLGKKIELSENSIENYKPEESGVYLLSGIPQDLNKVLKHIHSYRSLIRDIFFQELSPSIKERVDRFEPGVIGVHIRRGDFAQSDASVINEKSVAVRAPIDYFVEQVNTLRTAVGESLSVRIFSDGTKEDLAKILELENTSLVEPDRDMVDLINLSKCKIIVTSPGSTFSYWAGFLSNGIILHHPKYKKIRLRSVKFNESSFEGSISTKEPLSDLLLKNLQDIHS